MAFASTLKPFHPIFVVASNLVFTNENFQQSAESKGEQVGSESVHKHKIVAMLFCAKAARQ